LINLAFERNAICPLIPISNAYLPAMPKTEVQGTKAEVIKMKRGDRMVSATRKKHGRFAKWELVSSHIGRRSFATNHFGKIPTPIIMAATGHKSESAFLKYIGKGRAEMVSMLAEYWYGGDVEQKSKQTNTA